MEGRIVELKVSTGALSCRGLAQTTMEFGWQNVELMWKGSDALKQEDLTDRGLEEIFSLNRKNGESWFWRSLKYEGVFGRKFWGVTISHSSPLISLCRADDRHSGPCKCCRFNYALWTLMFGEIRITFPVMQAEMDICTTCVGTLLYLFYTREWGIYGTFSWLPKVS